MVSGVIARRESGRVFLYSGISNFKKCTIKANSEGIKVAMYFTFSLLFLKI